MCKYFFVVLFIYIFTYRNKQNDFHHFKNKRHDNFNNHKNIS